MEDYNKMKYWAEKKWENKKQKTKSGGDRVIGGSSCASRLLMTLSIVTQMLFGLMFW